MGILSHFNQQGEAQMVDISNKDITSRTAVAEGLIYMQAETLQHIKTGSHKKGDVLGIARIAGIMAAKKTSELIPLCHSLKLSHIEISFSIRTDQESICCRAHASATAKTGVEMEALQAVQTALLTIYDMCKAVERGMIISDIKLIEKSGGRSGTWKRE